MFKIPPLTSHTLAVNFDAPSSPTININLSKNFASSHSFGWGFGWYPGNQQSAMVVKDPAARSAEVLTDAIADWSNFRSNIFFCKVRGADSGYSQAETQPFSRSSLVSISIMNGFGIKHEINYHQLEKRNTSNGRGRDVAGMSETVIVLCGEQYFLW